jgi:hypothetical protein
MSILFLFFYECFILIESAYEIEVKQGVKAISKAKQIFDPGVLDYKTVGR